MKRFRVEHKNWFDNPTLTVTLSQPPYENENILNKTGWKEKDIFKITDVTPKEIK